MRTLSFRAASLDGHLLWTCSGRQSNTRRNNFSSYQQEQNQQQQQQQQQQQHKSCNFRFPFKSVKIQFHLRNWVKLESDKSSKCAIKAKNKNLIVAPTLICVIDFMFAKLVRFKPKEYALHWEILSLICQHGAYQAGLVSSCKDELLFLQRTSVMLHLHEDLLKMCY